MKFQALLKQEVIKIVGEFHPMEKLIDDIDRELLERAERREG